MQAEWRVHTAACWRCVSAGRGALLFLPQEEPQQSGAAQFRFFEQSC